MPSDPYRYFRIEARELVDQIGKAALDLERRADPALIAKLLRLTHTLKGAARVVKQLEIAELAHAIEGRLAAFRDQDVLVPREHIDAVLSDTDGIAACIAALDPPEETAAAPTPTQREALPLFRGDMAEIDDVLEGIAETHAHLGVIRRSLGDLTHARRLVDALAGQAAMPRAREPLASTAPFSLEAHRHLLDELGNTLGRVAQRLAAGLGQLDRELDQTRDAASKLRLMPASALFMPIERTVRDAARSGAKRVAFVGRGGEVSLDGQVLATLQHALVQLARNAVVHGIETPAERQAAGKALEGRISLDIQRRGQHVIFTCADDGRGVDVHAVRRALERRGKHLGDRAGDELVLRALMGGGVSTSSEVTEAAGRGIGLDVLREAILELGGTTSIRTEGGRGTSIEIVVPAALAAIESLVVESQAQTFAIPLDGIERTVRLAPSEVRHDPGGSCALVDDELIAFLPLTKAVGVTTSTRTTQAWTAVVLRSGLARAAVGVDRLLGTSSVILRPLPELAPAEIAVSGASLDGDGNPLLVIDPDALVSAVARAPGARDLPERDKARVLVIDDSLTTRMLEQSILESAGYEVDVAASGEEGLEKARARRYGLFLVDVEMPGIDGFTFVERAGAEPGLQGIPAILVTSRASPEDKRRGEMAGARAYVVKSEFDQVQLLATIRRLMEPS